MKRLFFLTISLGLMVNGWSKDFNIYSSYYGVNVYQSSTGSGYGSSTNVNINVQKFNRILELGFMFGLQNHKLAGVEFIYKHFTGFGSPKFYKRLVKPYFYYNFIYRMPSDVEVTPSNVPLSNTISSDPAGKMTTFEHSIGLGLKIKLVKQFYSESSFGFGVYFGSRYQGSMPSSWGVHLNNYGFVPSFKLGVGYQF
jgi:hypothetical protein